MKAKRYLVAILALVIFFMATPTYVTANRPGDILGNVLNTDIRVFINDIEIAGYNIDGYTYVIAEDLSPYGFNVVWNDTARTLSISHGNPRGELRTVAAGTNAVGSTAFSYVYTDIVAYIEGNRVASYNIQGSTVIRIDDLSAAYGTASWNSNERTLRVSIANGVSLESVQLPVTPSTTPTPTPPSPPTPPPASPPAVHANDWRNSPDSRTVWLANRTSLIAHSSSVCSNMRSPVTSTKGAVISRGGRACQQCWTNR
jgi:hypothetical protein